MPLNIHPFYRSTNLRSFKSPAACNASDTAVASTAGHDGASGSRGIQRQRQRTSSMPVENRKPRLADTRRSAIHCADVDLEYYRLRSFSITSHGICNLGDSMRKRRSRSITSVTSTSGAGEQRTVCERGRNNSNASQASNQLADGDLFDEVADAAAGKQMAAAVADDDDNENDGRVAYKVAMLGDGGVGKTALTYQFTTSDYICAYDLSLGGCTAVAANFGT